MECSNTVFVHEKDYLYLIVSNYSQNIRANYRVYRRIINQRS